MKFGEQAPERVLAKIDLACGQNKKEGFIGIDHVKTTATDIVCDLLKFPWPIESESVEEIHCSHFFEHIPGMLRPQFMDELYRVMCVGGKGTIIVPYGWNSRAFQDFTHQWPPVVEATFLYFNRAWREMNKLDHYPVHCDFNFNCNYAVDGDTANRHEEVRNHRFKHYINAINDMIVLIGRRHPQADPADPVGIHPAKPKKP